MITDLMNNFYAGSSEDAVRKAVTIVLNSVPEIVEVSSSNGSDILVKSKVNALMMDELYTKKFETIEKTHALIIKKLLNIFDGVCTVNENMGIGPSMSFGSASYITDLMLFLLYHNWRKNYRNRLQFFDAYEKKPYFPLSSAAFIYCARTMEKEIDSNYRKDSYPFVSIETEEQYDVIEDYIRKRFDKEKEEADFPEYPLNTWFSSMELNEYNYLDKIMNPSLSEIHGINGIIKNYKGKDSYIQIANDVERIGGFMDMNDMDNPDFDDTIYGTFLYKAFSENRFLKTLKMRDSVTLIGECSFMECESLETIVLSENLRTIEKKAFSGCRMLKSLVIPSSIKRIDDYAFHDCENLDKIVYEGPVDDFSEIYISSKAFDHDMKIRCSNGTYTQKYKR